MTVLHFYVVTQHATYDEKDPELKSEALKRLHNTISKSYMALILSSFLRPRETVTLVVLKSSAQN
jgi:hypothetical protein